MTRARWTLAAVVALAAIGVVLAMPIARQVLPAVSPPIADVAGAIHIHTNRSDGRSSPEEVAAHAARAGLGFVVFTDHGDATREPDPPVYRSGVLCIDAVEISTEAGHLIALGLPAAPYPLAGEARDVLEDVHRLGGIGIAAHPDSPKADLEWRGWDAPIDGIEVMNLDTVWRVHATAPGWTGKASLLRALTTYPIRPAESIAGLMRDHPALLARWDTLGATKPVPMLAGVDAHARLALGGDDSATANRFTLAIPGYEAVFRTLTMHVRPDRPVSGDASLDAALVLDALRRGHAYAAVDGIAGPPAFEFTARSGDQEVTSGDELAVAGSATVLVRTNAPSTFTTIVRRNGEVIASQSASPKWRIPVPDGPGVLRAEVRATDRPGSPLWILSNAIYLRAPASGSPDPNRTATVSRHVSDSTAKEPKASNAPLVLFDDRTAVEWHTEVGSASKAAIDTIRKPAGRELEIRYGLPGGEGFGQFAAAVADATAKMTGRRRLRFSIRASQQMRISVQVRVPRNAGGGSAEDGRRSDAGNGGDERWRRSVYVSETEATYDLPFADFAPLGDQTRGALDIGAAHGVLFTVDRVNTPPSASGRFWLRNVIVE